METGDSLRGNLDLVLTQPPKNVPSRAGKVDFEHEVFTWEDIRDFVDVFSNVRALQGQRTHILGLASVRWWMLYAAGSKRRSSKRRADRG